MRYQRQRVALHCGQYEYEGLVESVSSHLRSKGWIDAVKRPTVFIATGSLIAGLACLIQRPPVPLEYFDFRADLQAAVTDTAVVVLEGQPAMRVWLEEQLTTLAAIVRIDSLLATVRRDTLLVPLAGPIDAKLAMTLGSKDVGGSVRKAYRNRHGQRQAVDAVVIGLGVALRRLKSLERGF